MEEREFLNAAIETIAARFRSGNRIPVDKAQVPAEEWHALVAALASAPAAAHHPLMAPEALRGTIGTLLAEAMDAAVKNGADSRSMPDEYVALALWLTHYPAAS